MSRRFLQFCMVVMAAMPALAAWETPRLATQDMAAVQAPLTVAPGNSYFTITDTDVEQAVAEQLRLQAVEAKAEVSIAAGSPKVIHSADHALKLVLHGLQVDPNSRRWQAQANILAGGKTETVKPVSGTYLALTEVPVVTRQIGRGDVIEAKDLVTKTIRQQELRKDTVTDTAQLIGKSPRATISPNRPIRLSEVSAPLVIKRGDAVQMHYTSAYMSIRATGSALQDGAIGDLIRVKNDKSGKAVSGRITGGGQVEVNQALAD